jgi:hypothetical protein
VLENAKKLGKEEEDVSLLKVPMEDELVCVLALTPIGILFT